MTYRVLILAAALLAAVPASAQNAEGRWRAVALAPGGEEVTMVFNFEVSGNQNPVSQRRSLRNRSGGLGKVVHIQEFV